MKRTNSFLVDAISFPLFSIPASATAFWFALLIAFSLAGPLLPSRAAITLSGNVSPTIPSTWNSGTSIYIGNTASGTLTVDGGSEILSNSGYLGYGSSATGVVNIVGSGSTWVNTALEVGRDGSGLLSITNGGSVTSVVGYIGYGPTSTGVVTVDGAGSNWTNSKSLYVGYGGAGTLNIINGGSISVADTTYVSYAGDFYPPSPACAGQINFGANGGTLTTKSLFVSPAQMAGTGTINTRGLVSDIDLIFDSTHGLKRTFAIQQPGLNATVNLDLSDPNNLGSLGAGYYGTGSLTIRDGIVVNSTVGYLGFNAGSTGVATVDGTGSAWATSGYLYVGISGCGTLTITNGGSVSVGRETWVGAFAGSTGAITFGNNGGTLTTQSLLASPSQFAGTGTINTRGLVSDIDLTFDSTHALKRTLMFQQSGSNVTVNLDMSTNPSTNGSLGAGWRGAGSLTIQDGIKVSSTYGYLGYGNDAAGTATVSGTGSTWNTSVYLMVGYFGSGTLNIINGGTVTGGGCNIGAKVGSSGTVMVDGVGSMWTIPDQLIYVGDYGNGMLKITNGGNVSGGIGIIGESPGSTGLATVDGMGSTWTNTNSIDVGNLGNGTLSITNHGRVVARIGVIGQSANSTGVVTVDGAGSAWNAGGLTVGNYGSGTLSITRGGSVTSTSGYIGSNSGAVGVVAVDGAGSAWNAGGLIVGYNGSGTLRISNGGQVDDARGGYGSGNYISFNAGSRGTVLVDGIGSAWTNKSTLYIGIGDTGTLSITGGGFVNDTTGGWLGNDSTAAAYVGYGSTGLVTVDGVGSTWTNSGSLYVGYSGSGTVNISNGGSVSVTGTTYVGYRYWIPAGIGAINFGANAGTLTTQSLFVSPSQIAGTGTINTRGLVSDIDLVFDSTHGLKQTFAIQQSGLNATVNLDMGDTSNLGSLGAGYYGAGSLTIRDGIVVNSPMGYLGFNAGSTGVATVDGIGSAWINNGNLYVGYSGDGTLTVTNGGAVNNSGDFYVGTYSAGSLRITNGGAVSNKSGYIASQGTGTCTVTVDGAGSKWTNSGKLYVGNSGTQSVLNIINGGTVTSVGGNSTGVVTVDGAGSTWTDSGDIAIANGSLSITNGGSVSSNGSSSIGYSSSSTALVTVCGARSTLTSGSLSVGSKLLIANGGSVSDGKGYIAGYSRSTGVVTVDGAGSTWTSSSLSVGCSSGHGMLSITNYGKLVTAGGSIGDNLYTTGAVTVNGDGSMWLDSSDLYVGNSGSGTLTVSAGGQVSNSNGYVGYNSGSTGTATVTEPGSTWTNSGYLRVGNSGSGTLNVRAGGVVSATSATVNGTSSLTIDVGYGSKINLGADGVTNNGKTRFLAAAGVVAGSQWSPITAGTWIGSGVYEAVGGTWNPTSHLFTVSPTQSGTAGSPVAIDAAQVQRVLIDDGSSGWRVGVGFLAKSGTGNNINLTASATNGASLASLQQLLTVGHSILGAWNFSAHGAGYSSNNPVYLSFAVGQGRPASQLELWRFNGTAWSAFSAGDLTCNDGYASFTSTGLSNYAVTAYLPSPMWNANADGAWQNGANWTTSPIAPGGVNTLAILGPVITAPRTVSLSGPLALGELMYVSEQPYTLTGSYAITLQAYPGHTAKINVQQSDAQGHIIQAPLTVSSPLEITIAPSACLTLSGSMQNPTAQPLTLLGGGTLTVTQGLVTMGAVNVRSGTLISPSLTAGALTIGDVSASSLATVPEPSSILLLLTALAGIVGLVAKRSLG